MSKNTGAKFKGWIKNNITGELKSFQFNPSDLSYSRGVSYAEISAPGMAYPETQFIKGNIRTFPITLYLHDHNSTGLINEYMNFIGAFLTPETNVSGYTKPPDMTFCFGYFIRKCVLDNLNINIVRFNSNGDPIEAYFDLQLRQVI